MGKQKSLNLVYAGSASYSEDLPRFHCACYNKKIERKTEGETNEFFHGGAQAS